MPTSEQIKSLIRSHFEGDEERFLTVALQIAIPYRRYAVILKYLALSLFAYVITMFLVDQDWGAVAASLAAHTSAGCRAGRAAPAAPRRTPSGRR